MTTKPIPTVLDTLEILGKTAEERDRLRSINAELVAALEIATATIERLEVKHGTFSSVAGTLHITRAALAKARP